MQYGHFDNAKREYVIDRVDLPVSWTNYIGTGDMMGVLPAQRRAHGRPRPLSLPAG